MNPDLSVVARSCWICCYTMNMKFTFSHFCDFCYLMTHPFTWCWWWGCSAGWLRRWWLWWLRWWLWSGADDGDDDSGDWDDDDSGLVRENGNGWATKSRDDSLVIRDILTPTTFYTPWHQKTMHKISLTLHVCCIMCIMCIMFLSLHIARIPAYRQ